VVDRAAHKMIGTCGFTTLDFANNAAEVGYVLNPAYWGMGIAPEAVRRVIDFGFRELNVHRIEAKYMVENARSRRVMEKVGMTFEGVKRASMYIKGEYRDIGYCAILADEFIRNL
ncbi:MAG: GNAT family N-acetyltransferase, partial [Ruminococcaceae bacterium]|nr:GNAT family N-acetyltransferase [Oscillospiraceae bacterium]